MTTRTSVKDLVWETISGGWTKALAQKQLKVEKEFHPNHYVRMKKYAVGYWEIQMARKPRMGKKRVTESKLSGGSAAHHVRRDSFYVRGNSGKGY